MPAPELDERTHWDTLAAAIETTLGADLVFKYGQVPGRDGNQGATPPIYALLTIQRRFVAPGTLARRASSSGWRATIRYAGRTVDEAAWAALAVTEALDEVRLTIGSHESTPLLHESTQGIRTDDDRLSGQSTFIYAL